MKKFNVGDLLSHIDQMSTKERHQYRESLESPLAEFVKINPWQCLFLSQGPVAIPASFFDHFWLFQVCVLTSSAVGDYGLPSILMKLAK